MTRIIAVFTLAVSIITVAFLWHVAGQLQDRLSDAMKHLQNPSIRLVTPPTHYDV